MKSTECSTSELMEVLDVSRQMISNYIDEGMPKVDHGTFDLVACLRWKIDRLNAHIQDMVTRSDKEAQEIRDISARADMRELQLAVKRGQLVPIEDIMTEWDRRISSAKTRLLGMPSLLASQSPAPIRSRMKSFAEQQITEALYELSRADGIDTGGVHPEGIDTAKDALVEGDHSAGEADGKRVGRRKKVHPRRGRRARQVADSEG